MDEAAITTLWIESLQHTYNFFKGERANEIAGRYVKRFDERGLHPVSIAWGGVTAAETLLPELGADGVATSPAALREAAREDAWSDHLQHLGVS